MTEGKKTDGKIRIERMALSNLFPSDYNPRKALKPGDVEYERLANSIKTFGLVEPLIYNTRSKRLVGGHQRLSVLRGLGYQEVDVSLVDLDIENEKTLNLALNKISGAWDNTKLSELLASLDTSMQAIAGFSEADVDALLKAKASGFDLGGGIQNLDAPPMSTRGDVWVLGERCHSHS